MTLPEAEERRKDHLRKAAVGASAPEDANSGLLEFLCALYPARHAQLAELRERDLQ